MMGFYMAITKASILLQIFFFNNFIYFWLCCVFIAAHRLSLVVVSGGYSLVVVHGHLIVVASPFGEHGLSAHGLQ